MTGEAQRKPAGGLVVEFDRDPVAMGDDVMPRRCSWVMQEGASFDDLVRECRPRLASVAGTVGWLLTYASDGQDVPFAFLLTDPGKPVLVHRLNAATRGQTPGWHAQRQGGVLQVYAQYHSGAAPTPLTALSSSPGAESTAVPGTRPPADGSWWSGRRHD